MRRRWIGAALLVVLLLGWWCWPARPSVEPAATDDPARAEIRRKVLEPLTRETVDPELVKALALCVACAAGERTGEDCVPCGGPSEDELRSEVVELPEGVELVVDVVNEDGRTEERAMIRVEGCPVIRRDGNVYTVDSHLECVVRAYRWDGGLQIPSEEVRVVPGDEGAYVQLELRRGRTGGAGISFGRAGGAILVRGVVPGGPADALGLAHGDRILAVEGQPTTGMSDEDFVQQMTGLEGTEVRFTVEHADGERTEQVMKRAWIPPQW